VIGVPEGLVPADSVPQVVPPQPAPASDQITPLLWLSLVTVPVKLAVVPVWIEAVGGETLTEIGGVEPPVEPELLLPQEVRRTPTEIATIRLALKFLVPGFRGQSPGRCGFLQEGTATGGAVLGFCGHYWDVAAAENYRTRVPKYSQLSNAVGFRLGI